ncbi:PTS mannose transporter subunit IID [Synergistales bacterium]|nr:PTS mannose transporter subunit IID [Synergistales bacterium]GHV50721.1 PTS mannose transporter subunit IID [Synergistales bacterium]
MSVGILVVSHSEQAARGIAEIAAQMSGAADEGGVTIVAVGGNGEGGLGVSVGKIADALSGMISSCDGVLIIPDLGSSVLSSRGVIETLGEGDAAKVAIADAPILEGALMAAVEASSGSGLAEVTAAAEEARELRKNE